MAFTRIHHVGLVTEDLEQARRLHERALKISRAKLPEGHPHRGVMVLLEEVALLLVETRPHRHVEQDEREEDPDEE